MLRPPGWVAPILALVLAFAVGAGVILVIDRTLWDQELRQQLAEKDALMADLNAELSTARRGLEALGTTNATMRRLIDDAWNDTSEVARSHSSALEKLRSVIARLEALQEALQGTVDEDALR